jgi:hypothetical protein
MEPYMKVHAMKKMTFPEDEVSSVNSRLQENRAVYTTRVSEESEKYIRGDIVQTNLTPSSLIVEKIVRLNSLKEHPFLDQLTNDQQREIAMYEPPYDLIRLVSIVPPQSHHSSN